MDSKTKNSIQLSRVAAINKKRVCMYSGCNNYAIKSHVLQKNGILRQMSVNNHLIEMKPTSINEIEEKGMFQFKNIGVNDAYTFNGFCNEHDSSVFKEIEDEQSIDLYNPLHQCLFAYRGLCQEIRRKEISIEWSSNVLSMIDSLLAYQFQALIDGYETGVKNLSFFKREMEKGIDARDLSKFKFSTVKIPKVDLCISVPLNINRGEETNPLGLPYEKWRDSQDFPFVTSFINIFPYKQDSYFISGYHRDYPCKWTDSKTNKFSYLKNKKFKKELSDFIVLRLEFWVMSPALFKKISAKTLEKFKYIFSKHIMNHSSKIKTDINLFKNM